MLEIHKTISIFGAGSFGTALALAFHRSGFSCSLWGRDTNSLSEIALTRENKRYLPGVQLPSGIQITSNLELGAQFSHNWLIVPKAEGVEALLEKLHPLSNQSTTIILGSKGLSQGPSHQLLHSALKEKYNLNQICALSGPSFAHEVANDCPTAMVLAGANLEIVTPLAQYLTKRNLRIYPSDDVTGVLYGGAFKNILAIGAGIVRGAQLGENARAALVSRGFYEMCRLGEALGAHQTTLFGLSGLGDLSLTAMSDGSSRNAQYGFLLGQGLSAQAAQEKLNKTVEGASTARTMLALARKKKVELPVTAQIVSILDGEKELSDAINTLLCRPLPENEWPTFAQKVLG